MSATAGQTILVVDDDRMTVDLIGSYLRHDGYHVLAAGDGGAALELARQHRPALIVLDLMLPGIDGLDIARLLRAESEVPIIMLSARSTEGDVLTGLEVGADDYMTKPFSPRELVARVRTVLRRISPVAQPAEAAPPGELRFGPLRISTGGHQVFVGDDLISLTPREFRLLETLARAPGHVYTRAELLDRAAGLDSESLERAVDFHIMNLRRKIDKHVYPSTPDGGEPATCIETVFGIGYRFTDRFADPGA